MINYITEKDLWQAINSIKNENAKQLYNYMLSLRCRFKVLFVSYERLAARFGVCVKTIGIWMSILRNLLLVSDKKRWKKTSLYQINHLVLKFSEKYKQVFPALKHWTENALQGVYSSNVIHNTKDINNSAPQDGAVSQDSSSSLPSSPDFCENPVPHEPTVVHRVIDSKQDHLTFGEKTFSEGEVGYRSTMGSGEERVKKLTLEEWEEILEPTIKLTIPALIEWKQWALRFGADDEADTVTDICQ